MANILHNVFYYDYDVVVSGGKMTSVSVADVIDYHRNELLGGVLVSVNPKIATREYIKKKRLRYKFEDLLNLESELDDEIIERLLSALPSETVKEEYIESIRKIMKILLEVLGDKLKELEEYVTHINQSELENSLKIAIRKQKHMLESLRENLAELIIEDPTEDKIVIDEALSLAVKLYDRIAEDVSNLEKLNAWAYLTILLLRIIGVSKGKFDYRILYRDIAEISSILNKKGRIPEEVFEVFG